MNFAQARQLWVFVEFRQQQRPRLYDPGSGILLTLNVELNIRLVISFIHPYCRNSWPVEYKKTTPPHCQQAVNSTAFKDINPETGELVFVGSKTDCAFEVHERA